MHFCLILLSPYTLDSLLMSQVSILMSLSCFSSFVFPNFFFINAKRGKYCMIALSLLLAFLLNIIIFRTCIFFFFSFKHKLRGNAIIFRTCIFFKHKLRGKNLGLNLKLSHKVYNLFTLHVCNHFVCHYQKGGNCWLMSQINQMF